MRQSTKPPTMWLCLIYKIYKIRLFKRITNTFFFLLTPKSTNESHAASWNHGNVALFAFIFPVEINVYAAIIWLGSCDNDYCVCFSRHHGRELIISFVMGLLEMLSSSAVCRIKVFLFWLDCLYLWCKDKSGFLHSFPSTPLQTSCYTYYKRVLIGTHRASIFHLNLDCIAWTMIFI